MKSKILIAGASGFIGGNLARFLSMRDYTVFALTRPGSDLWRLDGVNTEISQGDITSFARVSQIFEKIKPDVVINCATHGVYRDQQDDNDIYQVNLTGTHNLLEAARQMDKKPRFIHTGSVYEYADLPGKRLENITGIPRNMYDTVKIMTTTLAQGYHRHYHLPITILRLFTAFGPFEDNRRLVPQLIQAISEKKAPNIAAQAIRDFVYIDDVMAAYESALRNQNPKGEVINIGSGQPTCVGDFVQMVLKELQTNIKPNINTDFAPTNDSQCWADISMAKTILNWEPKYNTSTAIKLTVNWHKEHAK